jgi:predicted permease
VDNLLFDLRVAWRALRRAPGATALAVLVLGLGIGANSAMFQLVNLLLFQPIRVEKPAELVGVFAHDEENGNYRALSYPDFRELRERASVLSEVTAHNLAMVGISEEGLTRRVFVDLVASNYLRTFGVTPILGRDFLPEDERPGAQVVMLGHGLWQRHGAQSDVVGSSVVLNGRDYTVIGVAPSGFGGTSAMLQPDLLAPLGAHELLVNDFEAGAKRSIEERDNRFLVTVARLPASASREAAGAELAQIANALRDAHPDNAHQTFELHDLSRVSISTSPQSDRGLGAVAVLLLGLAAVVLLIAALNLASVQGARNVARQRELAMRFALGSGRRRVVRQLLLEGLLVSLAGGVLGLLAAWAVPKALLASMSRLIPFQVVLDSTPDWRVVVATLGFSLLATVIFGLGPALRASRPDLVADLKEGRAGDAPGGRRWFSRANLPVVFEIAFTMVLLVVAGLFLKTALRAADVDPGFSLDDGVIVELDASLAGFDEERERAAYARVVERLEALPGARSASIAATVPLGMVSLGRRVARSDDSEQGAVRERGDEGVSAAFNAVGARYFETLGIPVLRGRAFRAEEAAPVAVIHRTLAETLWPNAEAVGRFVRFVGEDSEQEPPREVVGVVADIRDSFISDSSGCCVYVPFAQMPHSNASVHLRVPLPSDAARATLLASVREAVRGVDPDLPVLQLRTLQDHLDGSADVWLLRTGARIFGVFGAIALLLAVAGVYGVRALSVAQRTREIGIRIALGSSVRETLSMVLREGLRLMVAGAGIGVVLAALVGQALQGFLFDVSGLDPVVFALALAVLASAALAACWLPARRAARLQPLEALRHE